MEKLKPNPEKAFAELTAELAECNITLNEGDVVRQAELLPHTTHIRDTFETRIGKQPHMNVLVVGDETLIDENPQFSLYVHGYISLYGKTDFSLVAGRCLSEECTDGIYNTRLDIPLEISIRKRQIDGAIYTDAKVKQQAPDTSTVARFPQYEPEIYDSQVENDERQPIIVIHVDGDKFDPSLVDNEKFINIHVISSPPDGWQEGVANFGENPIQEAKETSPSQPLDLYEIGLANENTEIDLSQTHKETAMFEENQVLHARMQAEYYQFEDHHIQKINEPDRKKSKIGHKPVTVSPRSYNPMTREENDRIRITIHNITSQEIHEMRNLAYDDKDPSTVLFASNKKGDLSLEITLYGTGNECIMETYIIDRASGHETYTDAFQEPEIVEKLWDALEKPSEKDDEKQYHTNIHTSNWHYEQNHIQELNREIYGKKRKKGKRRKR